MPPVPRHRSSAAQDLASHTLAQIPSVFGRLAYMASVRDPHSGIYRHDGLATIHGEAQSAKALRQAHETVFGEWLRLPLAQKLSDLEQLPSDRRPDGSGLEKRYVPKVVSATEVALFLGEMEILLEILASQKCRD